MRLLLDTHTFLWFLLKDAQLSIRMHGLIADPGNQVELSPASYWELAIKISMGKYNLSEPFQTFLDREIVTNRWTVLPIQVAHAAALTGLPFHHKDPFDRMLVAQALVEQIPIVSADPAFDAYPITRLW